MVMKVLRWDYSGFGQSLPAVVVGRVVSGIGGAGMVSLVSIMITGTFEVDLFTCTKV